jgi:4-hydroxy-L-threonine phosphate dehydrogenase PdxA
MKPLIVTSGDPAGIGPEIVIKAVNAWHSLGKAQRPLLVSGDPEWFETLGKKLSITTKNVSFIPISWDKTDIKLGQVGKSSGQAGFESIRAAVSRCMHNEACGIVTAPINKTALSLAATHGRATPKCLPILRAPRHRPQCA